MPPLFLLFAATQAQVPVSTPPRVPSMAVGNEENREQLELARRQGAAYVALVDWERRGAAWSGTTDAADYRLAATITPAEGEWVRGDGTSHWQAAPAGQVHLRLFPQDRGSGRFVPGLQIRARFIDAAGTVLGEVPLPFALYPATDAYGANVPLPPGTARLAVVIEPMRMMRHDPYNGDRFFERTTAILPIALPGPVAGASASERAEATPPAALLATRRRALEDTIKTMWAQASSGGEQQAGGIIVTYAIEYAEAFWRFSPSGKFRYTIENEALNAENAHLEIAPRDPRTGRYVPAARVTTETIGPGGGNPRQDTPQLWHSWLYHFGKNVRVPRSGKYRLDVTVTPTPVAHYERQTGDAWWDPVSVSFADAEIKTGGSDAPDRFRCNRAARTRRRACAGRAARFPAHLHLRHAARRLGRGDAVDDRRGRQRVAVRQFRCGHDPQRADRAQHRAGIWRHRPALARRLPRFRGRARTAAAPYRGQAGGATASPIARTCSSTRGSTSNTIFRAAARASRSWRCAAFSTRT